MKIVVIGEELEKLREILSALRFACVDLSAQEYMLKDDDCIIFGDEMQDFVQIQQFFEQKLNAQQSLKIWSFSALRGELGKFGYDRDDERKEDLNQIFNFLFTGKKLPYHLLNIKN